jgi:hypothetical protein
MAILDIKLTNVIGSLGSEKKDVTLEWILWSDNINDFAAQIVRQGITNRMIVNGKAKGWLYPGSGYQLGNDSISDCYAGEIELTDRRILRGSGEMDIHFHGNTVSVVKIPPTGVIVQWKAKQNFSSKNPQSPDVPPENAKVTVTTYTEYEEIAFHRDVYGKLVRNSAGQFFDPQPSTKLRIHCYAVSRREAGNPLWKIKQYSGTVNYDSFWGFLPGWALLDSVTSHYDGEKWSDVTYLFKMKERVDSPAGMMMDNNALASNAWALFYLDTGYESYNNGQLEKILGSDGTPINEPALLNGYGRFSDDGTAHSVGPFRKYEFAKFAPLQLPNIFNLVSKENLF